jgi:ribosomal protein L7/L12
MKRIKIEDSAHSCEAELAYDERNVLEAARLIQHLAAAIAFDVSNLKKLTVTGFVGDKIIAIKAVRAVSNMGLKEAKIFVEEAQAGRAQVLFEVGHEKVECVTAALNKAGVTFTIN